MKRLMLMIFILTISSCASSTSLNPAEIQELITKKIEIVFTTTEPNYDEVMVTYYDFEIGTDIAKPYVFKYDTDGTSFPLKITLDNYKSNFIRGEGFRNNFSEAELKVQLFVDGILVLEEISKGTSSTFAKVNFNYDIPN